MEAGGTFLRTAWPLLSPATSPGLLPSPSPLTEFRTPPMNRHSSPPKLRSENCIPWIGVSDRSRKICAHRSSRTKCWLGAVFPQVLPADSPARDKTLAHRHPDLAASSRCPHPASSPPDKGKPFVPALGATCRPMLRAPRLQWPLAAPLASILSSDASLQGPGVLLILCSSPIPCVARFETVKNHLCFSSSSSAQ